MVIAPNQHYTIAAGGPTKVEVPSSYDMQKDKPSIQQKSMIANRRTADTSSYCMRGSKGVMLCTYPERARGQSAQGNATKHLKPYGCQRVPEIPEAKNRVVTPCSAGLAHAAPLSTHRSGHPQSRRGRAKHSPQAMMFLCTWSSVAVTPKGGGNLTLRMACLLALIFFRRMIPGVSLTNATAQV